MHGKWWVILADRLGPEILTMLVIKGLVVHLVRVRLNVPAWLLDRNMLLSRKWLMFLSRLNEVSGGIGNICFSFAIIAENFEIFDCKVLWMVLPTCSFISNIVKISGPNRSAKLTRQFTCIPVNVIYCITCTLCKNICVGQSGRKLADRFCEHLRDVEKKRHRCAPTISQLCAILIFLSKALPPQQFADYPYATGTQKAAKISEKNSSLNWAHPIHTGSRNASHSTCTFCKFLQVEVSFNIGEGRK